MASYSASYLAAFVAAIKNPNALGTRDWRAGRRLKGIRAQKKKTEARTRETRDGSFQTLPHSTFKPYKFQVLK